MSGGSASQGILTVCWGGRPVGRAWLGESVLEGGGELPAELAPGSTSVYQCWLGNSLCDGGTHGLMLVASTVGRGGMLLFCDRREDRRPTPTSTGTRT